MQEFRNVGNLFILTLSFSLSNWFVTNINAHPQDFPYVEGESFDWTDYRNPEYGDYFEGDIVPFARRQYVRDEDLRWPGGVVNYFIHSSITRDNDKVRTLELALDLIRRYSRNRKTQQACITFVRIYDNVTLPASNWVNITGHMRGCFSNVGRNPDAYNILNLNTRGCFEWVGHPMHEMLHTLGVYHEQSRPDRNKYVIIQRQYIQEGREHNFERYNDTYVTTFGTPYDYFSVMHYGPKAFTKYEAFRTIIPIPDETVVMGQRYRLSGYDIIKLRAAYKCP